MAYRQMFLDIPPIGCYTLIFPQYRNESFSFPEVRLLYRMRSNRTLIQLAYKYLDDLRQQRIEISVRLRFKSVIASTQPIAANQRYDSDDMMNMRLNDWISSNPPTNGSDIYIYATPYHPKSEEQAAYVGQNNPNRLSRLDNTLSLAFYLPDADHQVAYLNVSTHGTVEDCLNKAIPQIQRQFNTKLANANAYNVSVKTIKRNYPIALKRSLRAFDAEMGRIPVVQNAVIELKLKNSSTEQQQDFNLRINCKEKGFRPYFTVSYEKYRNFKCISLCQMAGLEYPSSYGLRVQQQFIKTNHFLSRLEAFVDAEKRINNRHLDCFLLDERMFFYDALTLKKHLSHPNQQHLQDSLRSTSNGDYIMQSIANTSASLTSKMSQNDDVHEYLPDIVKTQAYFGPFTAYTSHLYSSLNFGARQGALTTTEREEEAWIQFNYLFARRLQFLPYSMPNKYYRGVKKREEYENGEIIYYRQIISTSSKEEIAMSFMGKEERRQNEQQRYYGTFVIIDALSSRCIDAFSQYYSRGRREYEHVLPPYTPLRVLSARQEDRLFILRLEELPLIRDQTHKHLIYVGEQLKQITMFYNKLRFEANRSDVNQDYLEIDLLHFQNNQKYEYWVSQFGKIQLEQMNVIVIFQLGETIEEQLARIELIQQITAKKYICYNSPPFNPQSISNQRLLRIAETLQKTVYANDQKSLKYQVIGKEGFNLSNLPCCETYCNVM